MRTDQMRESENVEDRRGQGGGRGPGLAVGGGLGGIVIVIIVILLGGNPQQLLQNMQGGAGVGPGAGGGGGLPAALSPQEEAMKTVVVKTLGDTEDVWTALFRQMGYDYSAPTLVLFSGSTESGCGFASSATGPFYCPADTKVYIDLSFYTEMLDRKLGAAGDFAQAYVVAHEVGHHIQNMMGTSSKVHEARGRVSEKEYNDLSVRLELQADFYAGVWAHHANRQRKILEPGDIDEALRAASAVGDDRLQKMSRGHVVPDSFTHGTSEQRMRWFKLGFETGDLSKGDTFKAGRL